MKTLFFSISLFSSLAFYAQNNFKYLDINNVKAGVANRGDMHWDVYGGGNASYEVPVGSGAHSDFATGLWIGGLDQGNQLHVAAQTYRQAGVDFWPGPLDTTNGSTTAAISNQYDKIWKLNRTDVNAFITNFNNGNVQNGSYTPVPDLLSWPAQGVGQYTKNMAPFVDVNNNHVYDPLVGGDYPVIKGDQSLYYIFNDNVAAHQASGGQPLKVEIHATAYAYGNSAIASQYPFLGNATFYNYKIINRSNSDYHNAYVTLWTDVDIGYYLDDYIGCNVKDNYGYAYNADAFDETVASTGGYGSNTPAAGYQVLKGPLMSNDGLDNNNNGVVDEACEQILMSGFNYFNNSFPGVPLQTTDPNTASQYYGYMTGFWRDNTPFTCGGNAYGGNVATPFVYPGNTYTNSACGAGSWSESGVPGDRRYLINIGPFNFDKNTIQEIEFVHCTSFDNANHNPVAKLNTDMLMLKNFNDVYNTPACTINSVKEQDVFGNVTLFPNPANAQLTVSFNQNENTKTSISVIDVLGKVLQTREVNNTSKIIFELSDLASGIYFVKLNSGNTSGTFKFIKE